MIFLGDIACPYERVGGFIDAVSQIDAFKDELIVLNLEANILNDGEKQKPLTLYNASTVLDAFKKSKGVLVSLANNIFYIVENHLLHFYVGHYRVDRVHIIKTILKLVGK